MKRILGILLAVLLLPTVLLSSCKKEEEGPEVSEPADLVVATEDGEACNIVYARGNGYRKRLALAENLAAFIATKMGIAPRVVSDEELADTGAVEILVGNTNRAESAVAAEESAVDALTFSVRVVGQKLTITAGSDNALACAVDRLMETPQKLSYRVRDGKMFFAHDFAYTERAILVSSSEHLTYVANTAEMDGHVVLQGGCTDGKYIYICMENQASDYEHTSKHTTVICKFDVATMKMVAKSDPLKLDHSNDMCYNSKTGELVVVHCGKENKRNRTLSFVDPETLTILRTKDLILENGAYAMAYDAENDRYVTGDSGAKYFSVYDSEFFSGNSYMAHNEGNVTQGIDCDSDYIYFVLTGDGKDGIQDANFGYLVITDWKGREIARCRIPLPPDESSEIETECIFHIGNEFFVAYNARSNGKTGHIHRIVIEGLFD